MDHSRRQNQPGLRGMDVADPGRTAALRPGIRVDEPRPLWQGTRQARNPLHTGGTRRAGSHPPRRSGERRGRSGARRRHRFPARRRCGGGRSLRQRRACLAFGTVRTLALGRSPRRTLPRPWTLRHFEKRALRATLPCPGDADDAPCRVVALGRRHPFRLDPGRGKLPQAP
jgi:hypothetical protein